MTDAGPKIAWNASGSPCCTFTVCLEEVGKDNAVFKLFVPIEIWSKHAEWCAEHLSAGDHVLIDGRLKWRATLDQQGRKEGRLIVMAWQVTLVQPATPAAVSAN
jgi:single-stranded DNA-binding protein